MPAATRTLPTFSIRAVQLCLALVALGASKTATSSLQLLPGLRVGRQERDAVAAEHVHDPVGIELERGHAPHEPVADLVADQAQRIEAEHLRLGALLDHEDPVVRAAHRPQLRAPVTSSVVCVNGPVESS